MYDQHAVQKSLARMDGAVEPTFGELAQMAASALLFDMSVQVLTLSQAHLQRWQQVAHQLHTAGLDLRIRDLNRLTLMEWEGDFGGHPADLTLLAGFSAARRRHELSTEYVDDLLRAIPQGLIVLA